MPLVSWRWIAAARPAGPAPIIIACLSEHCFIFIGHGLKHTLLMCGMLASGFQFITTAYLEIYVYILDPNVSIGIGAGIYIVVHVCTGHSEQCIVLVLLSTKILGTTSLPGQTRVIMPLHIILYSILYSQFYASVPVSARGTGGSLTST